MIRASLTPHVCATLLMLLPAATAAEPIAPQEIRVIDGDTIDARGERWRLVGFDAPERGDRALCQAELDRATRATERLREIVDSGRLDLERVRCSCRTGAEGTRFCNHGRLCGTLRVNGVDVGAILIRERLAVPFICGATSCPPQNRQAWCER